ncbi:MAG TPA: glycosyltransferase family 4 protein [Thermoleophilaceae bacterium]
MRILVVSNLYPPVQAGGYEARCAATSEALRAWHDVHVLTSTRGRPHAPADPRIRRELPILRTGRSSIAIAPLASARAMKAMRKNLAEISPDLIFVWNGSGVPHAALQVAHESGIPVAYSVGEYWFGRLYEADAFARFLLPGRVGLRGAWARVARALNRLPALRVDPLSPARAAICWNSEATRRICGIPPMITPTHEVTIYPAVAAPELWSAVDRQPAAKPTIAYVGRVEPVKGPDVAYRALADLRDRHGVEARLVLAGSYSGSARAELDRLAVDLGISHLVELRGRLDPGEVARLLGEAHALVVPSVWEEPFGIVLLEAALARVPVVAARSGGMPEALREPSEALFFSIEDAAGCSDALAQTLGDPAGTQARVAAAYDRATSLSFDRYVAEMNQFVIDARESFDESGRKAVAR